MKTKKHKVEIPEGYEVSNVSTQDYNYPVISKTTTITFKPIKKELPKTWEEYCKSYPHLGWLQDDKWVPEKYIALGKLELLRDVYNDGCDRDGEYSIIRNQRNTKETQVMISDSKRGPLVFINCNRCEYFFSNFSELIETAKPLL